MVAVPSQAVARRAVTRPKAADQAAASDGVSAVVASEAVRVAVRGEEAVTPPAGAKARSDSGRVVMRVALGESVSVATDIAFVEVPLVWNGHVDDTCTRHSISERVSTEEGAPKSSPDATQTQVPAAEGANRADETVRVVAEDAAVDADPTGAKRASPTEKTLADAHKTSTSKGEPAAGEKGPSASIEEAASWTAEAESGESGSSTKVK